MKSANPEQLRPQDQQKIAREEKLQAAFEAECSKGKIREQPEMPDNPYDMYQPPEVNKQYLQPKEQQMISLDATRGNGTMGSDDFMANDRTGGSNAFQVNDRSNASSDF